MSSQLPRLGLMGIGGISQMTPAAASVLSRVRGMSNGTKKRRRKSSAAKSTTKRRKKKAARARKGSKLKKGSAAAKAYMAKIRKMRKK